MKRETIRTDEAPAAVGPYSQAINIGDFIFCSGQLGLDPATKQLADGVAAQAERALLNLKAVLREAGVDLSSVVKTTVYLADMADFKAMNEVYGAYFSEPYPARAAIAVKGLPLGGLVEIEAIAVKK